MMVSSPIMRTAVAIFVLTFSVFAAGAEVFGHRIGAGEWAVPRDGSVIVGMPALASAAKELLDEPASRLEIRYPGGDEGVLWAREMQAWLVALGFASARIDLVPGSGSEGVIRLHVAHGPAAGGWHNEGGEESQ